MVCNKTMLIRHAERPNAGKGISGVEFVDTASLEKRRRSHRLFMRPTRGASTGAAALAGGACRVLS